MTIERVRHSGAYVISELAGEGARAYLFTRTYYGYTLREAKASFRESCARLNYKIERG